MRTVEVSRKVRRGWVTVSAPRLPPSNLPVGCWVAGVGVGNSICEHLFQPIHSLLMAETALAEISGRKSYDPFHSSVQNSVFVIKAVLRKQSLCLILARA